MLRKAWHRALRSSEVTTGAIVRTAAGRRQVMVARLSSGAAVAFATRCPHQDTDLGGATVVDDRIRCPRHEYLYDPCTGENVFPAQASDPDQRWKTRPGYLPVYVVQERDGWIWVAHRPLPPPPTFDPSLEELPLGAEVLDETGADTGQEVGADAASVLRVQVGTTFEIRLPTNPLPGHTWEIKTGRRLAVVEQGLLPADPPRWQVRVAARKVGEDEIRCAFRHPWDVEPSERRRYVVRIVRSTGG